MALKKGWAQITAFKAEHGERLGEGDEIVPTVRRVSGSMAFETPDHEPRDEALALLKDGLERTYGPGQLQVVVSDRLVVADFAYTPETPTDVADLPKRRPSIRLTSS